MENEKIAISAENDNVESQVDQRFGRCKYFLIVEIENNQVKEITPVKNEGPFQGHGAGFRAAQQVGDLGVKAVITGSVGPNASAVLSKLNIKSYHASGTAKNAVDDFINNRLEEISRIGPQHAGFSKIEKKEGERIFIPLLDDKGEDSEISKHFGLAPFFGIYDVEKKELKVIKNDLDHADPVKSPIDQIEEAVNPTTIFAKDIGGRAVAIIAQKGLALKTGDYKTVKEVIASLDKLEDQTKNCGKK